MKKLLVVAMMAFGIAVNAQDGQFNIGANVGIPTGDASNATSFALSAEANYLFNVSDQFKVGPSVSFVNYFGKTIGNVGIGDFQFLPVSAAARFSPSDKFTFGGDLGYAVGMNTGNQGGFYYRPMIGYNVSEKLMVQATYSGITNDGATMSNFGLGVMFAL